jgi:hypothetical protein
MSGAKKKKKSAADQLKTQLLKEVHQIRTDTSVSKSISLIETLESNLAQELKTEIAGSGEQEESHSFERQGTSADDSDNKLWTDMASGVKHEDDQNEGSTFIRKMELSNSASGQNVTNVDFSNLRKRKKAKGSGQTQSHSGSHSKSESYSYSNSQIQSQAPIQNTDDLKTVVAQPPPNPKKQKEVKVAADEAATTIEPFNPVISSQKLSYPSESELGDNSLWQAMQNQQENPENSFGGNSMGLMGSESPGVVDHSLPAFTNIDQPTPSEFSQNSSQGIWESQSNSKSGGYSDSKSAGYSNSNSDNEKTIAIGSHSASDSSGKSKGSWGSTSDADKTVAVEGFSPKKFENQDSKAKIGFGQVNYGLRSGGNVYASGDATLIQAENLRIAQSRITELEYEIDRLRRENEELASAGEVLRDRNDELNRKTNEVERAYGHHEEQHKSDLQVVKDNLKFKDEELKKTKQKVEELEHRLNQDFKKIRVRERELEHRLELARMEKAALVKSKDEAILDLRRKLDLLQAEVDSYRAKTIDLNKQIDSNEDQFKRTVRALRLALSNLEEDDEPTILKKAE